MKKLVRTTYCSFSRRKRLNTSSELLSKFSSFRKDQNDGATDFQKYRFHHNYKNNNIGNDDQTEFPSRNTTNHQTNLMKMALACIVGSGLAWYLLKDSIHPNINSTITAQEGFDHQHVMGDEQQQHSMNIPSQSTLSQEQKKQLDLIFQSFKETVSSPGMQVAISQNGSLIYQQCFGFSNVEQRVLVNDTTKFRIASISKPISTVALALMIEKGLVDLDRPIFEYLSEESKKKIPSELVYKEEKFNTISLRQLASHMSGVRDYKDVEKEFMSWSKNYPSIIDACEMFIRDELVAKPGDKYSYSTYGYTLMSAVMEEVLKAQSENPLLPLETKIFLQNAKDFKSFCKKHIFDALEMNNTTFDEKNKIIYNRSSFYMRDTGDNAYELLNVPSVDNSYKWAGGGMLSTCQDLIKFANGLQKLLPGPLIDQTLWISQKTNEGLPTQYGIGFVVKSIQLNGKEEKLVYHTGGACGCCSILYMVPSRGISIAMIVNILHAKRMVELCEEVTRQLVLKKE